MHSDRPGPPFARRHDRPRRGLPPCGDRLSFRRFSQVNRRTWAVLLTATALALSGCTSEPDSGAGSGLGQIDINAKPADQVGDGGEFVWPVTKIATQLNHNQVLGAERDFTDVQNALLPRLFLTQPDATLAVNKDYLESAESQGSSPQVITYKINPKAVWSDGTPITWQDFDAQYKALNTSNPAFSVSGANGYDKIGKVEQGASEREVRVTFKQPFAEWRGLFGLLYPKSTNADPNVFNTGWTEQAPTTGGPFKWAGRDGGAKTITLVPNEKWWGEKPKLSKLIFREVPADQQAQEFAAGKVSFVDIGPNTEAYKQVQQVAGSAVRKALSPSYRHMTFNGAPGAILADAKLRTAIAKAVDRDKLAQDLAGPVVPGTKALNNHLFMPGTKYYKDNLGPLGFDRAAAERLLDEAGWKRDGAVRKKDGKVLELRDIVPAGVDTSATEAKRIQQQLAEVGVRVNVAEVPANAFFAEYVSAGNFDIADFTWVGTPTPISVMAGVYKMDPAAVKQNYGRIGNDQVNKLFDQANAEFDDAKRAELANRADAEVFALAHSVPLYQRPNAIAEKSTVANFGAFGIASIDYTKIGFSK
ncbi:ABC transporter family substrate-binding protein [Pseudonocardiaceae bacterium YIM PH 21723]|nr:ABC transporter family substrate-binding protein [Pseudonocardiaceae bacterium YIM PH 21723]